jgi:membrane fusion protein, multidrug efflux system
VGVRPGLEAGEGLHSARGLPSGTLASVQPVSLALLLGLVCSAGVGCARHPASDDAAAGPLVTVAPVERGPVADVLSLSGTLEPPPGKSARLGFLAPGRLAELAVAEGDHVQRGQVLARLEATPFRDARAQAEAALQQATAQALNARQHQERAADLLDAGAGPRKDVEDAQAQLASALAAVRTSKAAVSLAANQTSRGEVTAPMEGVVSHLYAAVGEPMDGSGKPILELAQVDVLEFQGGAPPVRAGLVAVGQPADVTVAGLAGRQRGVVHAVSPAVDPGTGLVRVRVQVRNEGARLKVGVPAEARVELRLIPDAIRVPLGALVPTEAGSPERSVNVLATDGHARRRGVQVGVEDGRYAEILSGLSAGERVLLSGSYALPDGTAVQVADGGVSSERR